MFGSSDLGIISNKSDLNPTTATVKANTKIIRGTLVWTNHPEGAHAASPGAKCGQVGVSEADSDNSNGAKGDKIVCLFGSGAIVTSLAGGDIAPTDTRLKAGMNGRVVPMGDSDGAGLHIADYHGKRGESGSIGRDISSSKDGDEISIMLR